MVFISAFYLTSFLLEFKVKKSDCIWIMILTLINCLMICIGFIPYLLYMLFLLFFILRFKKSFLKKILIFYIVLFSFIAFAPVITPHLIYRLQILNLTNSKSFIAYFLYPLAVLWIYYGSLLVNRFIHIHKFHYKVILFIDNKIYRKTGYFDSGNTLIFNNKPVVFVNLSLLDKTNILSYQKVENDNLITCYSEGKIMIKNKIKKVIFAQANKKFNGCDCLLSAFLL